MRIHNAVEWKEHENENKGKATIKLKQSGGTKEKRYLLKFILSKEDCGCRELFPVRKCLREDSWSFFAAEISDLSHVL